AQPSRRRVACGARTWSTRRAATRRRDTCFTLPRTRLHGSRPQRMEAFMSTASAAGFDPADWKRRGDLGACYRLVALRGW
ncbi:class II aldolase/adducin family protein, partial [Burkholderia pseudomallei]